MRFLMMHKADRHTEAGTPPPPSLVAGMGRLIGDMLKAGVFLDGGGLHRSSQRVRVQVAGGRSTVQQGPYTGDREVLTSVLGIKVKTMDDALAWASRYGEVFGTAELEVGPLVEPWDLGAPRPAGELPLRCLILHKATAATEAGEPWPATVQAALAKVLGAMRTADVLLFHESLQPSASGARLRSHAGKRTIVDGPFAESKELFGGYVLLQLRSRDECFEWANRFVKVMTDAGVTEAVEMDLRLLAEPHDRRAGGQG